MGLFDGQTALITGAGQGVGQGIALALAAEGAQIVVAGRTESKLHDSCALIRERGGKAIAVGCDVVDAAQIEHCIAAALEAGDGGLDILVNNAQIVPLGSILDTDERAWQAGLDSGPTATLRFMKGCHAALKSRQGSIVNLASSSALRWDMKGYGLYAAAKEAIRCLTRAAAHEWAADGIRVNCILPLALSPGMAWWRENNPEEAEAFLSTVPMGRIGDCEKDIGRAVVFMCGPDAGYITAQSLVLDGGQANLG